MTCFHPIKVWKQTKADLTLSANLYYKYKKVSFKPVKNREEIEIPCGRCLGCKLDHAAMWATRCTIEAKQWQKNCFVTLTYNNPNLPLTEEGYATLVKKDIQDFLKRLRYYEKGEEQWEHPLNGKIENPIRYFCCGEYGPKGGRPHYHLALFNYCPKDLKLYKLNKHGDNIYMSKTLQDIWGKGFVVVEDFNYTTASYIARYCQKKAGLNPTKREYTGETKTEWKIDERNGEPFEHIINTQVKQKGIREDEFITMSRGVGIGRTYWEENKEKIKRNKGILLKIKDKVQLKPIPKYFKKLWEQEDWEEYYHFKYEKQQDGIKKKMEIISKVKLPDGTPDFLKWEFYLDTQEKILKSKAKYLKRNEFI